MKTSLNSIAKDIEYIKRDISDIKDTLRADYVNRSEFEPIKKLVYGLVSLILVAVVGAIVTLVVNNGTIK